LYRATLSRLREHRLTPDTYPDFLRRCGAQVGEGCWIASLHLDVGIESYLLKIGNRVRIDRDVALLTHDGAAWIFRHAAPDLQVYGPVVIEDDCRVGRAAILCPDVRIGANSVVAAGSVVINDVPPNTLVAGIPARPVAQLAREPACRLVVSPRGRTQS
jgi:acetyltransferase-like isoleucine patch superfamily enzyme